MSIAEHASKALAAGLAVAVVGWAGQALTLAGRVTATEASLSRIELRLDTILARLEQPTRMASTEPATAEKPPTRKQRP